MLGGPGGASSSSARMVSGTPVVLESYLTATDTSVRIYVDKPAGAADGRVIIEGVIFDQVGTGFLGWYLMRSDASTPGGYTADGAIIASASGRLGGFPVDPDSTGALALVDREASLVGPVRFKLYDGTSSVTADATLVSDGYAALARVGSSTVHRVWLQDFRGNRPGRAQPLDVVGAEAPNVPLAPLGSRSGPLVMHFDTFDAAALVEADLATGQVHQLRQDDATRTTMDAYLVATDLSLERVSGTEDTPAPRWAVTCTYQETARGAYL
jgi:hypothetical protein